MKEIAPGVWAETGHRGCNNSCVVTDAGLVLVDPPMCPSHAVAWKEAVSALGEVKVLINTEHHGDHAGGNWFFRDALKVSQAFTRRDTPEGVGTLDSWRGRMEKMDPEGLPLLEGYEVTLQDVTYDEAMTLRPGGREIRLIHKPGHTGGQTLVYVPDAGALFPGDNVVVDWPPLLHSGVGRDWLACLDFIEGMDVAAIVPGHGELCDKGAVPPLRADILELMDRVRGCAGKGMTEAETRAAVRYDRRWKSVPDAFHERYEMLFDEGVGRLYHEVGGER
ncbi:MAG TPA: MBL fold metallo-hydrolase [Nitrospinota bacterium]|jgi:glyoxylase-like metal-dependent hydrolase (beta-lactamase superfamily II)|nr:MBL fold metallo-hydrolase [Nitrospinota bacterium]